MSGDPIAPPAAPGPMVIEVRNLVKRFGAFVSVDDLSLSVRPGEVFGLLGSNGAGKTTTIRMLCGLLTPTSGEGRVLGYDVGREPEQVKRRIGYMTQRFSLYDDLTVSQNIRFFGGVYGLRGDALRAREEWAVQMAGLQGKTDLLTRSLPGGWKQRLALACSVLHEPKVLFLDEPTGGVDPISRRRFWTLIDTMAGEGVTIIVTTHYLDEAERCDRIALMHAGRLVALGTVGELKEVFAGRALLEVSCPRVLDAHERLETEDWVLEASVFGTRLHVVVGDAEAGRRRIREALAGAGFAPVAVERILPSLEDVFIHCIEAEEAARAGAAGVSPRKVWAIALKELRQASRDPLSLAMLLGLPTMMLILYGYAINFDVRHVSLAVEDRDKTTESRDLVASFVNSTYFDLVADLPAGTDLERLTERRIAKAVLVIPDGYARLLAEGRRTQVQLVLDGADANTASTVLGYASTLVTSANVRLLVATPEGAALAPPGIDYEPRVWFNPELKSTQFLVPGLIGFILMLTAVLSTALSVVREKERGTMEQLRVTSLRPGELILGKTLPYLAISLTATAIIVAAARFLFGVRVQGSYVDLFVATLIYLVGALGFGLLVSSIADTQAMAFQVGVVTSMLPAIFLSGFIFPIRSMPAAVQGLTYLVPNRYFLVVLRGLILKGAPLSTYAGAPRWDLAFLCLYGVVVFAIAYARLTRKEA